MPALQVERSPSALSYQIRTKLAFAQFMEAAMQRAIAARAPLGERDSQRINALASAQLTEAFRLTEHALKGCSSSTHCVTAPGC